MDEGPVFRPLSIDATRAISIPTIAEIYSYNVTNIVTSIEPQPRGHPTRGVSAKCICSLARTRGAGSDADSFLFLFPRTSRIFLGYAKRIAFSVRDDLLHWNKPLS